MNFEVPNIRWDEDIAQVLFGKPALSINDVDIIKQIQVLFKICQSFKMYSFQVKDFNHFVDRNEANFGKSFDKGGKLDKV